jgi:hypothetical protein
VERVCEIFDFLLKLDGYVGTLGSFDFGMSFSRAGNDRGFPVNRGLFRSVDLGFRGGCYGLVLPFGLATLHTYLILQQAQQAEVYHDGSMKTKRKQLRSESGRFGCK